MEDPPEIVFTTAHREHAVEGFELNALDYLMKPVAMSRLSKAVERYRAKAASAEDPHMSVRADRKTVRIRIRDIRYIESIRDYVKIVTSGETILTKRSLTETAEELEPHGFVRIHRSFLVNRQVVSAFSSEDVVVDDTTLPVGRAFRAEALAALEG
jgi:DNA-binding LytR/AlgR family response regulator